MPDRPYDAGRWLPERARFDGLPTRAVHAFSHGLRKTGRDMDRMADDEIAALSDDDLLALPHVGVKIADAIRSRFPYRPKEAV